MPDAGTPPAAPPTAAAERLIFASDWLASRPFFYNVRTGRAGHDINAVIDLAELEFDPEGFNDYLDFGFSVFERTPVRDVRMLRRSARLLSGPGGLRVEYLADPAHEWFDGRSSVADVLELAAAKIAGAAATQPGDVVVPTSGGLDSRLIDVLLPERSRLRAFTYGTSDQPARSFEAMKALELARRLGFRWELVPLGDFHRYFAEWNELFGVSTHAHGMYQIEFYRRVAERVAPGSLVLSGACGEWFAGDDDEVRALPTVTTPEDVLEVFRYGGMCGRSTAQPASAASAWERSSCSSPSPGCVDEILPRVVAVVRIRMALLSYLVTVPASLGLRPRAPFLDIDLAMGMLTLPAAARHGRRWQHEFFARYGVDLEAPHVAGRRLPQHSSTSAAMRRVPLEPLDDRSAARGGPAAVRALDQPPGGVLGAALRALLAGRLDQGVPAARRRRCGGAGVTEQRGRGLRRVPHAPADRDAPAPPRQRPGGGVVSGERPREEAAS